MATRNQSNTATVNENESNMEEQQNTTAIPYDPSTLGDDYMPVSLSGFIGLLPPYSDANADAATISLANRFRRHAVYTAGQQQVEKLRKAGVSNADMPAALNSWLATWEPKADSSVDTLGSKRREIATELYIEFFAAKGRTDLVERIRAGEIIPDKNKRDLFPPFMAARKADIDAKVHEWALTYTPPKAKNTKSDATPAAVAATDFDADEMDFSV